MKTVIRLHGRILLFGAILILADALPATAQAQDADSELATTLEAIQATPPTPSKQLPQTGTFYSAQHALDWPPLPANLYELSAWSLGDGFFLLDDADLDYEAVRELMVAAGLSTSGPLLSYQSMTYTTNDLWLEINGVTNGCTDWTADLTIHTPDGDTNLFCSMTCCMCRNWDLRQTGTS